MNCDSAGDTLILGTKGGLRIPSTECWNGTVGGPLVLYHEVAGEQVQTVIPDYKRGENEPSNFDLKIRTFADAIKNGGPSPIPSSEIIYNQAIIDGIARSADLGREIVIEIPEV
jgi:predicted dehydrogenase